MNLSVSEFQRIIWNNFRKNKRRLPWRYEQDPYKILVSEVMLQQTQVERVRIKYQEFLTQFPTVWSLAQAPLASVLIAWQGMGYNRRAKYLKDAAGIILKDKRYEFLLCHLRENGDPDSYCIDSRLRGNDIVHLLQELPGIGHATASAIVTYAFNFPVAFIETNIRAVYLYFFFKGKEYVSDTDIMKLVDKTMDKSSPKEWVYALTDYGHLLKKTERFRNVQSKVYNPQPRFEGSARQLRGCILRVIAHNKQNIATIEEISSQCTLANRHSLPKVLAQLVSEKLICTKDGITFFLPK